MKHERVETDELVSIVIPAYNSEKYIKQCLSSLYCQTYTNFEIIVAYDEKSTDNTLGILHQMKETHILIVDEGNDTSSGAARNRGFKLAKGKYVIFVDADDEVMPEYISSMMSVFKTYPELNVVCCGVLSISDRDLDRAKRIASESLDHIVIYERDHAIMLKIYDELRWGAWAHLIRRVYLVENAIQFPDCSVREDFVYTLQLFMGCERIGYSSKIVYLYLQHESSMTQMKFDKWWQKSQISRYELEKLAKELPNSAVMEIKYRDQRLVAAGCACQCDYPTYRAELTHHGVTRLYFYHGGDTLVGRLSVITFNISKYLYYRAIRFMKGM